MNKDPLIFINHIAKEIAKIEQSLQSKTKEQFVKNMLLQDATIRRIEVIGEAVKNIPTPFKDEHKEIPWQDIIDTRNKLIHHYFGIDLDLTWEIIKKDIPSLKSQIMLILLKENVKKDTQK